MSLPNDAPPSAVAVRSIVEDRLHQAMLESGAKITVDWRGEQKHLHVISMEVDSLYFNPDTHRIRAQRTIDPDRNRRLEQSPWSDDGQDYLQYLLSRNPFNPSQIDPDYVALQEELQQFGQKDPGIISPSGILVDGNTRCAALRELGVPHIRVGVLPPDTSSKDINSVELALQLRRDKRRDYSYMNRLITIDEQISMGRRAEDVARDFNIKMPKLQQDLWVFQLVNDAIRRSKTPDGTALKLLDFEEQQEKLRELYRDFTKLAKSDPNAAELLKESRLAMIVLNFAKTTVRLAESDFFGRYLEGRLPPELRPKGQKGAGTVKVPGLPGVVVKESSKEVKSTQELTNTLLQAKALAKTADILPTVAAGEAQALMGTARKTFDQAARLAGQNASLQKRQVVVSERLTDAADYVEQCATEFAEAKAKRALDEEAFDDALLTLRASLIRLAKQAGRTFSTPGTGVEWLLNSTRETE